MQVELNLENGLQIQINFSAVSILNLPQDCKSSGAGEVKNSLERTLIFAYYRRYRLSSKVVLSLYQVRESTAFED